MSTELTTPEQKTSYCVGLDVGASFKRFPVQIDFETFVAGVSDMVHGEEPKVSQPEFTAVMREFHRMLEEQNQEQRRADAQRNLEAGKEFMSNHANNPDVDITDSGLQIETLSEGSGPSPDANSTVRVHYTGTLIDGTEFDSSVRRGQPTEIALAQAIPGWTEGLQHLNVGGKARLVVPPDLAYGERGAGQVIGPNQTLVFEVELLDIVD